MVLYPGFTLLDLAGPQAALGTVRPLAEVGCAFLKA